jgi:AraC-like DNA-binding protein
MALADCKNYGVINKMMAESYTYEAIAHAVKLTVDSKRNTYSHSHSDLLKMSIVKDKIRTHPEMDHSLTDLADEVGLSVSGLKTKFREIYGKPVFQYLREVRMICARHGIEQEGWTVQQAAFFAGYKHPENFSTAFQKIFGVLPSKIL